MTRPLKFNPMQKNKTNNYEAQLIAENKCLCSKVPFVKANTKIQNGYKDTT